MKSKFSELYEKQLTKTSQNDIQKIVDSMMRVIDKSFGSKFYPIGLETFDNPIHGKGTGYRLVSNSNIQLRFNNTKGTGITGVDYWKPDNYEFNEPSILVEFEEGLNIISLIDKILHDIKRNKLGTFHIDKNALSLVESNNTVSYTVFTSIKSEKNSLLDKIESADKLYEKTPLALNSTLYDDLDDLVFLTVFKYQNSLIVAGGKDFSKDYTAVKKTKELIDTNEYAYFTNLKTPYELYSALFSAKDKVIIIEKSDSLIKNSESLRILNDALKVELPYVTLISDKTENVSTFSDKDLINYSGTKIPSKFMFSARVIFISDLLSIDFDNDIKSDAVFVDIPLHKEDVNKRIKSLIDLPKEEISIIMDTLTPDKENPRLDSDFPIRTYLRNGKNMTYRGVQIASILKNSGLPLWADLAQKYS